MSTAPGRPQAAGWRQRVERVGAGVRGGLDQFHGGLVYVGRVIRLLLAVGQRAALALRGGPHRIRRQALVQQAIRVGVRSIPIIVLVQIFIGIILSLSMARPLDDIGQLERVADVVALATFREMGALISAVILSGFAGASIAAELGAMAKRSRPCGRMRSTRFAFSSCRACWPPPS